MSDSETQFSPKPDYGQWQKREHASRHGLLIIHGIGEQKRGDTLHAFLNDFYNYIHAKVSWRRGREGQRHIALTTDLIGQKARIVFRDAQSGVADEFIVREVWWAKAFPPLDFWRVVQWLVREVARIVSLIVRRDARWRQAWTYLALWWLIPGVLLTFLLIFLIPAVLQWLPVLRGFFNVLSQRLRKMGATFLVGGVGDLVTYSLDLLYASEIRHALEREIDWMKDHVDDMHVVGHSLGSLVGYEVLSRTYRRKIESGDLQGKVRSLITVGSPLDKVHWFVKPEHYYRFTRDLPGSIQWVNIYTAYDLVADRLSRFSGRPTNVLVTNKEIPFFALAQDHVAYWQNYQVMEWILRYSATTTVLKDPEEVPKGLRRKAREIGRQVWRRARQIRSPARQ